MVLASPATLHHCGPLAVEIRTEDSELFARAMERLSLFDVRWEGPFRRICIALERGAKGGTVAGTFLVSGRMSVDASEHEITAAAVSGIFARARLRECGEDWEIAVPAGELTVPLALDFEHALELALTTGWRRNGWVPVHAGAVERSGRCVLLCARSNGGKSTFAAALVREGWRTLGDDKVLLRLQDGSPQLAAVTHAFSLFPRARRENPDLGIFESFPPYSVGSEKRRVPLASIAPQSALSTASPTHVVQIDREVGNRGLTATPLPSREAAAMLLRQIVIPRDRSVAGSILRIATQAALGLKPSRVTLGEDVYRCEGWARRFEEALA